MIVHSLLPLSSGMLVEAQQYRGAQKFIYLDSGYSSQKTTKRLVCEECSHNGESAPPLFVLTRGVRIEQTQDLPRRGEENGVGILANQSRLGSVYTTISFDETEQEKRKN